MFVQGIAVHPDMTYALIRPTELSHEDASVFIVAQERLEALSRVIGTAELVAHIRGPFTLYNFAAFMLTLTYRIRTCWCPLSPPLFLSCLRCRFRVSSSDCLHPCDVRLWDWARPLCASSRRRRLQPVQARRSHFLNLEHRLPCW